MQKDLFSNKFFIEDFLDDINAASLLDNEESQMLK